MRRDYAIVRPTNENTSSEKIVQAAERLIRKYGYRKTTVTDVAKELGLSAANVYRFYRFKDDLRRAVVTRLLDENYIMALNINRLPMPSTSRIKKLLRKQLLMTVDVINNHHKIHELILLALLRDEDLLAFHMHRLSDVLADMIVDGICDGEFADQDPHETSLVFIFATAALWHPKLLERTRVAFGARPDDLIDFALDAVRTGRCSSSQPSGLS